MNIYVKKKKVVQNIAIFLLVLIGLKNLFLALPLKYTEKFSRFYDSLLYRGTVEVNQVLSFLLGVLMLILANRLYKRLKIAWVIEMITLTVTIIQQVIRYHELTIPIVMIELFVWIVLGLSYKDFRRKSNKMSIKTALGFASFSIIMVLLNATIGMLIMKNHLNNIQNIQDALLNSIKLLFVMDTNVLSIPGKIGHVYADSLITINWICVIVSSFLILKPLVYNPIENKFDKEKTRGLVKHFGQNPIAYLSLENDKKYFFGQGVNGVCSYQVVGNVFVVCGDIICDEKNGFVFLSEILAFCDQNGYNIMLMNITDTFYDLYKMAGFGIIKYGEDACFNLTEYNLNGGKVAKVRAAINHANNAGISVVEYKPLESRDYGVEHQISDITNEWKKTKGDYEMKFMLGGTGLDNPLDRRYFYAVDTEGKILGFVVFLPYLKGKGYLADVTHRRSDSPQGTLEKIIYDAFMQFKSEGVIWGNMGLSPLYNVTEDDKATIPEKLFNFIYENMNKSYGFKALQHAKAKYAPTEWRPRYLAYNPRPFLPNYALAILRVQVGKGLKKIVITELGIKKNERDKA